MKELQPNISDKISISNQQQIQKRKHVESLVPFKGQKLWELNKATGEINQVEFEVSTSDFSTGKVKHSVPVREGFKYVLAINKRNATRRFFKDLAGR